MEQQPAPPPAEVQQNNETQPTPVQYVAVQGRFAIALLSRDFNQALNPQAQIQPEAMQEIFTDQHLEALSTATSEQKNYTPFDLASTHERRAEATTLTQWKENTFALFQGAQQYFAETEQGQQWAQTLNAVLGQNHEQALTVTQLGQDQAAMDTLYQKYFTPDGKSNIKQFVKDVVDSQPFEQLSQQMEAIKWISHIFGQNSTDMIEQLIYAEAKVKNDVTRSQLIQEVNHNNRINSLTNTETTLLNFVLNNSMQEAQLLQARQARQAQQAPQEQPTPAQTQDQTNGPQEGDEVMDTQPQMVRPARDEEEAVELHADQDTQPLENANQQASPVRENLRNTVQEVLQRPVDDHARNAEQIYRTEIEQLARQLINFHTGELGNTQFDLSRIYAQLVRETINQIEHGEIPNDKPVVIRSELTKAMLKEMGKASNELPGTLVNQDGTTATATGAELLYTYQGIPIYRDSNGRITDEEHADRSKDVLIAAYLVPAVDYGNLQQRGVRMHSQTLTAAQSELANATNLQRFFEHTTESRQGENLLITHTHPLAPRIIIGTFSDADKNHELSEAQAHPYTLPRILSVYSFANGQDREDFMRTYVDEQGLIQQDPTNAVHVISEAEMRQQARERRNQRRNRQPQQQAA